MASTPYYEPGDAHGHSGSRGEAVQPSLPEGLSRTLDRKLAGATLQIARTHIPHTPQ